MGWWMDVPSTVVASARNTGDVLNGEPLVLAFVELLVSVPVALALFSGILFLASRNPFSGAGGAIAGFLSKVGFRPAVKDRAIVAPAAARQRMEAAHREFL